MGAARASHHVALRDRRPGRVARPRGPRGRDRRRHRRRRWMRLQLTRVLLIAVGLAAGAPASAKHPRIEAAAEMAVYTDTDHVTVSSPSGSLTVGDAAAGWSVGGHYLLDA